MEFYFIAFLAGGLTVLAPCILPVLPVILAGSLGESHSYNRPFWITFSLAVSLFIFTLALKVFTIFIPIPRSFWPFFSGTILSLFGVITIWPFLWERFVAFFHLSETTHKWLHSSSQKKGILGLCLLGFSLGPVFASCSPVYFVILGTVLPQSFLNGIVSLLFYILGLSLLLFSIGYFGRTLVSRFRFFSDPSGFFKRLLGVLFLLLGVLILTGLDKTIEAWVLNHLFFDVTTWESWLLDTVDME